MLSLLNQFFLVVEGCSSFVQEVLLGSGPRLMLPPPYAGHTCLSSTRRLCHQHRNHRSCLCSVCDYLTAGFLPVP